MSNYLNIDIPTFWCFLDTGFLYNKPPNINNKRIPIEVFSFQFIKKEKERINFLPERELYQNYLLNF